MRVTVCFYSYFRDLAGCSQAEEVLLPDSTLEDLWQKLAVRFPRLAPLKKSALTAVGVDYRDKTWTLEEGDEVSLFPPVQGG